MEWQKIQIKVNREGNTSWSHFCYVPAELKQEFDATFNHMNPTKWILKWAQEDFKIKKLDTWEDLESLKSRIKNLYKDRYPELYIESTTDNQGWLRVWYTLHMEKEMNELE
mgnify:CR=1 FL=1|jgi:hypothetical protein